MEGGRQAEVAKARSCTHYECSLCGGGSTADPGPGKLGGTGDTGSAGAVPVQLPLLLSHVQMHVLL